MPEEKNPIEGTQGLEKGPERWQVPSQEKETLPEIKEGGQEKEIIREREQQAGVEELQKEIEKVSTIGAISAIKKGDIQIKNLDTNGKIARLLDLAKEKGVDFAINVAKGLDDPYLLDILHDKIIEKGIHKEEN
jgi:hypothetical protein